MLCCLVMVIVLGAGSRFMPWRTVRDDGGFAPTAVRSTPDDTDLAALVDALSERPPGAGPALHGRLTLHSAVPSVIQAVATGVAASLPVTVALMASGLARTSAPGWVWLIHCSGVAMLTVAVMGAAAFVGLRWPQRIRGVGALGVMAIGIAGALLTVVEIDTRLVDLYQLRSTTVHLVVSSILLGAIISGFIAVIAATSDMPARTPVGSA
ncbi:hypothetical protein GPOL_c26340 [Gordonia polyisoprenivorans VH2]|uniref:Transmembrane protein n=1 Tax=Gordonia polyisoprenivorans (strain DSM 44266 / VH2) TaxID=1112204 RepID=H6MQV9_GORPV|nr:hypothetical protein [Gordonia polyisoprenivorans]AFA73656.1 hypothetical protein GPOL_c26340 [Gordonia polyisoprenivorans VH2]